MLILSFPLALLATKTVTSRTGFTTNSLSIVFKVHVQHIITSVIELAWQYYMNIKFCKAPKKYLQKHTYDMNDAQVINRSLTIYECQLREDSDKYEEKLNHNQAFQRWYQEHLQVQDHEGTYVFGTATIHCRNPR
jgi:hypothetical protein